MGLESQWQIVKNCLHLTFSSQTVMITESFSLVCLDWRLHPGDSWGNVCWFWSATMYWGGESIYGGTFNDEDFVRRHTQERCCQNLLPKQHLRTPSFFETLLCWQLHVDSQQRCFWCREAGVVSMANKGSKPRSFIFQEDSVHRNSQNTCIELTHFGLSIRSAHSGQNL